MVRAEAHLRDGGLAEFDLPDDTMQRIEQLRRDEHSERAIIQKLITDDWAAPPRYVEFRKQGLPPVRLDYDRTTIA